MKKVEVEIYGRRGVVEASQAPLVREKDRLMQEAVKLKALTAVGVVRQDEHDRQIRVITDKIGMLNRVINSQIKFI